MTPKQARRRQEAWDNSSKRGQRCPMCRRPFADCSHSVTQVDRWLADEAVRAVARAAAQAAVTKLHSAHPSAHPRDARIMAVVSESYLRETLRAIRTGDETVAMTRLKVALDAVFTAACDDLKDVVAGRVVNSGGDVAVARAAGDAIDEYASRIKDRT